MRQNDPILAKQLPIVFYCFFLAKFKTSASFHIDSLTGGWGVSGCVAQ